LEKNEINQEESKFQSTLANKRKMYY